MQLKSKAIVVFSPLQFSQPLPHAPLSGGKNVGNVQRVGAGLAPPCLPSPIDAS